MDWKKRAEDDRARAAVDAASAEQERERDVQRQRIFDSGHREVFQRYSSAVAAAVDAYNAGSDARSGIRKKQDGQFNLILYTMDGPVVPVTFDAPTKSIEVGGNGMNGRLSVRVDESGRIWVGDDGGEVSPEDFADGVMEAVLLLR